MIFDTTTGRFTTHNGTTKLTFDELGTGATYVKVADQMPSLVDPVSLAARKSLEDLDPIFVDGPSFVRGYYVPATPGAKLATNPAGSSTSPRDANGITASPQIPTQS